MNILNQNEASIEPQLIVEGTVRAGNEVISVEDTTSADMAKRLAAQKFTISRFKSSKDNKPMPASLTWPEFREEFLQHQVRGKKDGKAWSPVSYKAGSTRKKELVEWVYMAVLDVDNGTPIEAVKNKLAGYTYLAHSSYNHTPEHSKYRVIVPFDKPVPASEWDSVWARINLLTAGINDPAVKDASRLYFTPGHPVNSFDYFSEAEEGKLLSVDDLPELESPIKPSATVRRTIPIVEGDTGNGQELGSELGLKAVVERCEFMKFASTPANQPSLTEPLWRAMISNACRFENSHDWIHTASDQHHEYDEEATDKKITAVMKGSAPITCQYIREQGYQNCPNGGCKKPKGEVTKAPAGLSGWSGKGQLAVVQASASSNKKPSNLDYAMQFAYEMHGEKVAYFCNQIRAYKGGYWPALDLNAEVKLPILNIMGDTTAARVNSVCELVKIRYAAKPELFERKSGLTCLSNGTLNPLSGKLLPHSPSHQLTNKLDITFDPEAKCPLWLQTLAEIFAPDYDRDEKIQSLQEYIGYCLIPDTRMCKFVWFIGPGGNGKSLILEIVEELIGKANISSAHIDRFQEKFVRAELQGKLVNISAEMNSDATVADSYLKQIVSGDLVEAERKHEPSFSFRPYAKIIASTNKLPRLQDHSVGFERRAIFFMFNRKFTEPEQDKQRKGKLLIELPGILNWAVAGLQRLMERGMLSIPPSSKMAVDQYCANADPVRMFADEFLVKITDNTNRTASGELFERFKDWSLRNNYRQMASNTFAERLTSLGYEKKKGNKSTTWNIIYSDLQFVSTNEGTVSSYAKQYDV